MSKLFIFSGVHPGGDLNHVRHLKAGQGINIAQSGHDATLNGSKLSNVTSTSGITLWKQQTGGDFQFYKIVGKGSTTVRLTGANTIEIKS